MVDVFYWVLEIVKLILSEWMYFYLPDGKALQHRANRNYIVLYQQTKGGNFDPEKHTYS